MTTQRRARNMVEPASTVHLVDRKESISTMSMASKVTHSSMGKKCFKDYVKKFEITLREQNPPLKCCQPLELFTHFERGIDL